MRAIILICGAAVTLAGCIENPQPLVVDYNEASVKVQQLQIVPPTEADKAAIKAEADRICGTTGRRAEYASTTVNRQTSDATHLFLCLR